MKNNRKPSNANSYKVNDFGVQNKIYNLFTLPASIKQVSVKSGIPEHIIKRILLKLIKAGKIKPCGVKYCYESMSKVEFYVKSRPTSFTIKPLMRVIYGNYN